VLIELTGGLSQLGHRIVLAALQASGAPDSPALDRVTALGVEVVRVRVPSRAYGTEFHRLREVIETFQPDVVQTHGYRADLLGGLAARCAEVPWVSTAHGFTGGDLKNRFYERLQRWSYRRAQAVIAVSAPLRAQLISDGVPPKRAHFLANAWAPKPLLSREAALAKLGLGAAAPVIGWVGRLTREKGADLFLEALALISDQDWCASIVGDGRERQALEAQAERLGIGGRVHWHGLQPGAAALYPAFDVWVLSSRTEGTPIALFEALAARVPVVTTMVGGVPDVVSSAEALLVEQEQPAALAAAIGLVLADPCAAAARAESAYQRLLASFATTPWLDAHVALYRAISRPDRVEADA